MSEGACLFLFCRRGDSPQRKKDISTPLLWKSKHRLYFKQIPLFFRRVG